MAGGGGGGEGTAAEKTFRREVEERAATPGHHANLISGCGHDIKIVYDWGSIDLSQYIGVPLSGSNGPTWQGADLSMLTMDYLLTSITRVCGVSPELKEAAGKIKTFTFHGMACDQLPLAYVAAEKMSGFEDKPIPPGYGLAITDGGANVDVNFCPKSSNLYGLPSHMDTDSFFKANL